LQALFLDNIKEITIMARSTWILFGMSIVSMFVGVGLVLVFMHTLVVPSINKYRHVWDQCLVLNISEQTGLHSVSNDFQDNVYGSAISKKPSDLHGVNIIQQLDNSAKGKPLIHNGKSHLKHTISNTTNIIEENGRKIAFTAEHTNEKLNCYVVRCGQFDANIKS
jgi:lipopolysaccharide export LptBFGC system permease protein LptF